MLTIQELRQLPTKDLLEELEKVSRSYLKIKMDVEEGFSKGSHKARALRKQIARIKTVQREIVAEEAAKEKEKAAETPKQALKKEA